MHYSWPHILWHSSHWEVESMYPPLEAGWVLWLLQPIELQGSGSVNYARGRKLNGESHTYMKRNQGLSWALMTGAWTCSLCEETIGTGSFIQYELLHRMPHEPSPQTCPNYKFINKWMLFVFQATKFFVMVHYVAIENWKSYIC